MGKVIDLVGYRYGALEVLSRAPKPEGAKSTSAFWLCRCDCGNTKVISGNVLKQGKARSCGCLTSKLLTESHSEDLTNKRFGSLTVISRAARPDGLISSGSYWLCKCDCGNEKIIMGKSLQQGKTKSCGCHSQEIKDITGQRFGKLVAITQDKLRSNEGKGAYWLCSCDCGQIKSVRRGNLINGNVKSCGCISSSGELEISKILQENNINYSTQYSFDDLRGPKGGLLRFDFAIFKDNKLSHLIEFQGEQHYEYSDSFFDIPRESDVKKQEYCKEHNIHLILIPYWKRGKITLKDLMGGDEE